MQQDYNALKKTLQELLDQKKQQKAMEEMMRQRRNEEDRNHIISTIGKDLTQSLKPILSDMAKNAKVSSQELRDALKSSIDIQMPAIPEAKVNVEIPPIKVPKPEVTVNVPPIKIPEIKWPKEDLPIKGWVQLMGVDLDNPLPVQLRDAKGKPVDLFGNITQVLGGGGGKADYFTVKALGQSAFSEILNPDGRVKVEPFAISVTGFTDSIAAAIVDSTGVAYSGSNPIPVVFGSGGTSAVNVVDSTGVAYTTANPLPVTITSGGSATSAVNIVDSTGVAFGGDNPLNVDGTVVVSGITNSIAANIVDSSGVPYTTTNPLPISDAGGTITVDGTVAVTNADITSIKTAVEILDNAISGNEMQVDVLTLPAITGTVAVSGFTNSVGASILGSNGLAFGTTNPIPITWISGAGSGATQVTNIVDSSGVVYSGSNPLPVNLVSQGLASSSSVIVDSTGVQYSGSNPVPVILVANAASSTVVVGSTVQDAVDDGSAPVQIGGIARQAVPTAVAANDVVKAAFDDVGRQLVRPVSVRDATVTAYASFSTGTEATLLAASSGYYQDLIYILASNASTAAVGIDIRAGTAGSVIMHLEIPANGTVGVATPVPIPGPSLTDGTGNAWTVDLPDITGTTVYVSGLFTKEI